MLASKTKEKDRQVRLSILQAMKVCLEMHEKTKDEYWLKEAKYYGEESKRYKERMQNHDYAEEDALLKRVDELQKEFNNSYNNI